MHRRTRVLGLLAAGTLLAAGCADDDGADGAADAAGHEGTADATTALTVTGTDELAFDPDEFTVPAGEEVTVELTSQDGVEHDFVVTDAADAGEVGDAGHGDHGSDDEHTSAQDLHVVHADPGETATGTLTIDEAGEYDVRCDVPGHSEAGMTATLVVE